MATCPACGVDVESGARFCSACGSALSEPSPPAEPTRRTVTLVFTDLTGSTAMGERLDPEAIQEMMARYYETASLALERHGGTIEKFVGDAVMAAFGIPVAHEDDAIRAVRAAAEMREALAALNAELEGDYGTGLRVRTGVNTGEVIAADASAGHAFASGDAVNVAARLEQAAGPGEILIGERTFELVRDAVEVEPVEPLELKGKAEPVSASRLLAVEAGRPGLSRRLDLPLVGRSEELRVLARDLASVTDDRQSRLALIVGDAGSGKSRLIREFSVRTAGRARLLQGHCLAYGEGTPLWAIDQALKAAAGIGPDEPRDDAREKLAALVPVDADSPQVTEVLLAGLGLVEHAIDMSELYWAIRRVLHAIAADEPVVLCLEDVHWADPPLLELLDHLISEGRDAQVLIVCSARPEFVEQSPSWPDADNERISRLNVAGLAGSETEQLIREILGSQAVPGELRQRVTERAGGNPLFVEELLRLFVDRRLIWRDNGAWQASAEIGETELPPSVEALLTARLDRLDPSAIEVIEAAAVCGETFWRGAIDEMAGSERARGIVDELERLVARGFVEPERSALTGEPAYRFTHALVRQAAYKRTRKRKRAQLHERFAAWIEGRTRGREGEYHEVIGYHLEQAHDNLIALGPATAHARELGDRAAEHLMAAGRRALAIDDSATARSLMERAESLVGDAGGPRARVLLGLGEALLGGGEWGRAREVLESATALALETDQPVVATAARNRRRFALLETDIDTWPALKAELDAELVDLVERGDAQALAEHWLLAAQIEIFRGSSGSAADAAKQAVHHASSAGDERLEAQARLWLMSSQTLGPTPRAEAIRGAIDTLEWARPRGAILAEAAANCERGWLEAIGGDFSVSRKLLARALEAQEDLGVGYWVACNLVWIATVELLAGSLAEAEHAGRRALKLLEAAEDRGEAATGAGVLAEILVRRGSLDEADRIASYAEAISAASDVDASTRWRASRARILVERGHLVEAQRLAEEGVTGLGSTDQLNVRGEALFALAEVRSAAGDLAGARGAARAAIDAFDAKGNIVSAQRVASFLKDTQSRG